MRSWPPTRSCERLPARLAGQEVRASFGSMVIARFALVALDCPDPHAIAGFYQSLAGGEIKESTASDEWVRLQTGPGTDIGFQRDANYEASGWPDGAPQQAHLDFDVADLDEAEQAVLGLGASKTSAQPSPSEWRVFLDPAGHPFCLVKA